MLVDTIQSIASQLYTAEQKGREKEANGEYPAYVEDKFQIQIQTQGLSMLEMHKLWKQI